MESLKVRMILCDVDGTLLKKGTFDIPQKTFDIIRKSKEKGVRFVIASGRSLQSLRKMFAPVLDAVSIISCDGTLAVSNGEVLYKSPIDKKFLARFLYGLKLSGDEKVILYGDKKTYCIGNGEILQGATKAETVCETEGEIFKIAFLNLDNQRKMKIEALANNTGRLTRIYSDSSWTEFIPKDSNKGKASSALQSLWGISPFETAAFGDNTNDFEMLRTARLTYASPDAIADIKMMCKYCVNDVNNEILNILEER